jgi:hypothetical protein
MNLYRHLVGLLARLTAHSHGTYLLTTWSRVLLEKVIGSQLIEKLTAFYGLRKLLYCIHKCQTYNPVLSQINPIHVPHIPLPEIKVKVEVTFNPEQATDLPTGRRCITLLFL